MPARARTTSQGLAQKAPWQRQRRKVKDSFSSLAQACRLAASPAPLLAVLIAVKVVPQRQAVGGDGARLEVVAGPSRCSTAHLSVYRDVIEDHGNGEHALERRVPPGVIFIPVDCLADLHCGRACAALQFS